MFSLPEIYAKIKSHMKIYAEVYLNNEKLETDKPDDIGVCK